MSDADQLIAEEYLRQELRERAPRELRLAGEFDERPLETEGAVRIFAFELGECGDGRGSDALHYVVAGETKPNYFPAYGLGPDDAYSVHLGTRFLLEMAPERVAEAAIPAKVGEALRNFVRGCNPRVAVGAEELALAFRVEDQYLAVYRVEVAGAEYWVMGGDLPPGFYAAHERPAQIALRLHLGRTLREEARRERK